MKELNFYTVDPDYIEALQAVDPRVPNIKYETHDKFACGVLFEIAGHEYFAPISSFKHARRIKSKALHVYRTATSGEDAQMAAVCCDFKALERYVRERYGDDRG